MRRANARLVDTACLVGLDRRGGGAGSARAIARSQVDQIHPLLCRTGNVFADGRANNCSTPERYLPDNISTDRNRGL
jgi:hypothetical protein